MTEHSSSKLVVAKNPFSGFKNKRFESNSAAISAWWSLLLLLPLLVLSRLCLFFFNIHIFNGIGFKEFGLVIFGGLRFDLSILIMVNFPFIIVSSIPFRFRQKQYYRFFLNILFSVVNSILLLPNYVDAIYYRFTMKRMSGDFLNYAKAEAGDIAQLLPQYLKDFWPVTLLWLLSVSILILIVKKVSFISSAKYSAKTRWREGVIFVGVIFLSIIGIRGGLQLKPINIITAGNYAEPRNVALVYSSPFSIVKTYTMQGLTEVKYFTNESEMTKYFNPLKNVGKSCLQLNNNSLSAKNVVIIILESFSAERIGALSKKYNSTGSLTPFLDSLIGQSLSFAGISNSKRSIEALPAILASLPSLMNNDFITSPYAGDQINSIASILRKHGYATSFYHGGSNGTMGFDAFCRMAGIENYYGRTEYNNDKDYDGKWGIWDEDFFQFFAKGLNTTKEPFVAGIFSLSSHHPYSIPAKYKNKFKKGTEPIEFTISYTDYALQQYFKTAEKQPWFKNTLFVITADHTSESKDPYYQSRIGNYSIPIIFYKQGSELKGKLDQVAQQTDIMPSVLDYLKINEPYIAFGNSVFDTTAGRFAVNYISNTYCLCMNPYGLIFENGHSSALYNTQTDILSVNNLLKLQPVDVKKMEPYVKSYIQQYNSRVLGNRLVVK